MSMSTIDDINAPFLSRLPTDSAFVKLEVGVVLFSLESTLRSLVNYVRKTSDCTSVIAHAIDQLQLGHSPGSISLEVGQICSSADTGSCQVYLMSVP
jgi:hypothetical protein